MADTIEIGDDIFADVGENGEILGIEIWNAKNIIEQVMLKPDIRFRFGAYGCLAIVALCLVLGFVAFIMFYSLGKIDVGKWIFSVFIILSLLFSLICGLFLQMRARRR